jgi:GT2 family glycosyltransferase
MTEAPLSITALVVTRGRHDGLARCLASLAEAAQAEPAIGLRIAVAVNGDDPRARALVERAPGTEAIVLEPAVSPATARNRLLERAPDSGWILFIDDDAFAWPGFFSAFRRELARVPGAAVIGGPNLTPPGSTRFQRASGAALSSRLATFFSSPRYRAEGPSRHVGEESLSLCNLFVRADRLERDPFPGDFHFGEENWMLQRMTSRGQLLAYAPALHVFHERRPGPRAFAGQIYRYGEGRARNLLTRPSAWRWPAYAVPAICVLYSAACAARLATGGNADRLWLGFAAIYAALCLAAAATACRKGSENLPAFAVTAAIFPLLHVAYGIGFLNGALGRALSAAGWPRLAWWKR